MKLLIFCAVWLFIGAIFLISWIRFHRGLKTPEQIMDEAVNTNFESITVKKSIIFDNNIRIEKINKPQHVIAVFNDKDNLRETVGGLSIQEAAEIAYVHQNFKAIWKQL